MPNLWAGIDAGKGHHHCVVIDDDGTRLLSRKFANDEREILALISDVTELGKHVRWACDLNRGGASLLISILLAHAQELFYIPGRSVHHAARTYRGDGKTDAKDAGIIADQARMRRDLQPLRPGDQIATDLRLLTARRIDLACDRTRTINRLRATLLEYFPALEAAFDFANAKGAMVLLTKYHAPESIRRAGVARITTWLRNQGCYQPARVAQGAVDAVHAQHVTVETQRVGAPLVKRLAEQALELRDELAALDAQIEERLREHEHATVLLSVPGFGPLLAADFIAATGGDMTPGRSSGTTPGTPRDWDPWCPTPLLRDGRERTPS